ncbi:condensation domain-containing protein, partial [Streptomyces klenkii]|uniref:condensation domain-containing protein n=1 Tax=Streptomyces klenkii TaxID=1420899 RepID=UPI00339FEB0A
MPEHPDSGMPLTVAQLRVWRLLQAGRADPALNIGGYMHIGGPLDPLRLKQAVRQVIDGIETLHVRFVDTARGVRQVPVQSSQWPLHTFDLRGEPSPRPAAEGWMRTNLARGCDPRTEAPFTAAVFKVDKGEHFFYMRTHHIVMDGHGFALLAAHVAGACNRLNGTAHRPLLCTPLRSTLDDETAYLCSAQYQEDKAYWLRRCRPQLPLWPSAICTQPDKPVAAATVLNPGHVEQWHHNARRRGVT